VASALSGVKMFWIVRVFASMTVDVVVRRIDRFVVGARIGFPGQGRFWACADRGSVSFDGKGSSTENCSMLFESSW